MKHQGQPALFPPGMYEDRAPRPGLREFKYVHEDDRCALRIEATVGLVPPEVIERITRYAETELDHLARRHALTLLR